MEKQFGKHLREMGIDEEMIQAILEAWLPTWEKYQEEQKKIAEILGMEFEDITWCVKCV